MLRLHRHRHHSKSGDKVDFKVSAFKAFQVPKGWDKLVVSFVSVETGKTVAKTGKAVVRNGSCQWPETLSESIRVSEDDLSVDTEISLFKLIVSMGSARSGILGEATVNMKDYMSSSDCIPVSLSLKKCTYGTTLQVKIQCMTPRTKSRDEDSKQKNSGSEIPNDNYQDTDIRSEGSGSNGTAAKSVISSSTKDFCLNSNPGELGSRETSFSISESHQSYDSAEGSIGGEDISVGDSGSEAQSLVRHADSLGSENNVFLGSHTAAETFHLKNASFSSQITGSEGKSENSRQDFPGSSLTSTNSAKNFREASEGTVEELRVEAKMWERNARKLMLDLDVFKGEFSDLSKIKENLCLELSEACAERDVLKKEFDNLKLSFENSLVKQTSAEDLTRDELRFQKESNADLALQLKKSHDSNIELVSVLQELEETVEKQKIEIEDLLELQSKSRDAEKMGDENIEENRTLRDQLQQFLESEKNLKGKVKLLEQALEEKNHQIEKGKILNSQTLLDDEHETECKSILLNKEEEFIGLKAKLSESINSTNGSNVDIIREFEKLKEKVQELERDCNELTEENLELLFKLKEAKNESTRMKTSVDFPYRESFEFQLREQQFPFGFSEDSSEKKGLKEIKHDDHVSVQALQSLIVDLEAKFAEMESQLAEKSYEVEKIQVNLRSKEEEILVLRQCQSELEAKVSDLQKEKVQIQEHMEVVLQESHKTSQCLNDLQNNLTVLTSSVDSHSSANKLLERKSFELETGNRELELHATELEQENTQLKVLVASLEDQLRGLTSQLEYSQLELESSKSNCISLNGEVNRLRIELQSTVESFIAECDFLHKSNGELSEKNLGLHNRCSILEAKLEESHRSCTECSKKVDELEQHLSSVMAEFASKEKSLTSEIGALVEENFRHKEKVNQEVSLLNQMHMEKVVEVQNLQQQIEHLIKKLSETHEENERMASDFLELQSKVRLTENELKIKEVNSEVKLKRLSSELVASNQEHEKLLNLVEYYKSVEEKFKTMVSDLELKLTVSEYQRQQLSEESSYMKVELKKLAHLEDELGETKAEKEKLEASVRALSEECNDLKMEKNELIDKVSLLKTKLLQMEDDLLEHDVLLVRDTELQKELSQIRNENRQYQLKIEQLQEERDESQRRSQAIEEKQNPKEHNARRASNFSKTNPKVNPVHETAKFSKSEMGKSANQRRDNRRNQSQSENGGGGCESPDGNHRDNRSDPGSKIQLLEDQLVKALEENSKYKAQLNKIAPENRKGNADAQRAILEAELRDIRERYSSMSLKYAEAEAQREALVMKLKSTAKTSRRWFS